MFVEKAVAHIAAFTTTDSDQDGSDPTKWAVYRWLMHMLYSTGWEEARKGNTAEWEIVAMQECSLYPSSQWSQKVADELQRDVKQDDDDREVDDGDDIVVEDVGSATTVEVSAAKRKGWRLAAEPWKPLPIGVVEVQTGV